ncbi:hypothetical protein JXL21_00670 [Candidatus Bathyarchaeota archaeon]|nr:hypothetical protein [Candidatus Bathyarchaeota archaeon]
MKTSEQIYWIKVVGALVTGGVCTYLQRSLGLQGHIALMAGTTLYIALSEGLAMITKVDRNRTIKIGIGAFLFLWILVWVLLNTLFTHNNLG